MSHKRSLEQKRLELEGVLRPSQSINNYWPVEQPVSQPGLWLIGGLALPLVCAAFLWGLQTGYNRSASDVAAAKNQAAIAHLKVEQVKACVEAVQ